MLSSSLSQLPSLERTGLGEAVSATPQLKLDFESASVATVPSESEFPSREATFRPIHYLGSKLRVIDEVVAAIDEVDPGKGAVLDLFAGSGTVARALSGGRRVFASDIQEYSRVISSALLAPDLPDPGLVEAFRTRLAEHRDFQCSVADAIAPAVEHEEAAIQAALRGDPEPICDLLDHGSFLALELEASTPGACSILKPLRECLRRLKRLGLAGSADATAMRYFGGSYFSYAQAAELDVLSRVIDSFGPKRRDTLLAALLSTASDVVNTVGKQFAQPIRPRSKDGSPKHHLIAKITRDRAVAPSTVYLRWLGRYAALSSCDMGHAAIRADYVDALERLKGDVAVVYADPPYTRDHYSRFYHVLETLALRDNPSIAANPGAIQGELSRGLYREDRHQSPFCIKSQVHEAFSAMFAGATSAGASLILSYSPFDRDSNARPRLMSITGIIELAEQFYREVEVRTIDGVSHSKLNHTRLNYEIPPDAEVMFLCKGIRL
jgi:adenine-specific DNA-methyltransferase